MWQKSTCLNHETITTSTTPVSNTEGLTQNGTNFQAWTADYDFAGNNDQLRLDYASRTESDADKCHVHNLGTKFNNNKLRKMRGKGSRGSYKPRTKIKYANKMQINNQKGNQQVCVNPEVLKILGYPSHQTHTPPYSATKATVELDDDADSIRQIPSIPYKYGEDGVLFQYNYGYETLHPESIYGFVNFEMPSFILHPHLPSSQIQISIEKKSETISDHAYEMKFFEKQNPSMYVPEAFANNSIQSNTSFGCRQYFNENKSAVQIRQINMEQTDPFNLMTSYAMYDMNALTNANKASMPTFASSSNMLNSNNDTNGIHQVFSTDFISEDRANWQDI